MHEVVDDYIAAQHLTQHGFITYADCKVTHAPIVLFRFILLEQYWTFSAGVPTCSDHSFCSFSASDMLFGHLGARFVRCSQAASSCNPRLTRLTWCQDGCAAWRSLTERPVRCSSLMRKRPQILHSYATSGRCITAFNTVLTTEPRSSTCRLRPL